MENNLNTRGLKVLGDVIDNAMSIHTSIVLKDRHNKYKIDPNRLLEELKRVNSRHFRRFWVSYW
jgi:hypothetical protein